MEGLICEQARIARIRTKAELADQLVELAGHLNAANYRFLMLLAEFDRLKAWSDGATYDCAHWLNWKCGIDMGAAREKVRTARALEQLPKVAAAMQRGELSYSKARAITRVADAENEEYFLKIALHGTADHVETLVRIYRRAKESEELSREHQQQMNRCVRYQWADDGSLVLNARLPAETGALVLKALEVAMDQTSTPNPPPVEDRSYIPPHSIDRPSIRHRRADALGIVAESFIAHGAEALKGGDRHQIVIHVSAETLKHSSAGRSDLDDGPALAPETVRRLACDASLVALVENEKGEPLNVGRKTRSIPPALQRALNARDHGCCRFPGCTHKRFVDSHHIEHWAHGGETKLSNLVTLCRFHHRKVHEGAVIVQVLDDGAIRFVQPDGGSFDSVAPNRTHPIGDWTELAAEHARLGIHITKKTAATRWQGDEMDYGLAMATLRPSPLTERHRRNSYWAEWKARLRKQAGLDEELG